MDVCTNSLYGSTGEEDHEAQRGAVSDRESDETCGLSLGLYS